LTVSGRSRQYNFFLFFHFYTEHSVEEALSILLLQLWNTHHNPKLVLGELKESLNQLRTNYVDMFLMHYPTGQRVREHIS
jgi:diketogulonate reductase-like aldo/keto reductase